MLSGHEGGGGCGSVGAVFPGQEGSGVRLKKGSDNQHVVGGACDKARDGGGTGPTTAAVRNVVPRATAAFLQGWKLSCSGKGEVVVTMAATAAAAMSLRWQAMLLPWRLREQALDGALRAGGGGVNVVTMAVAMLSRRWRAVEDATRGGGWTIGGVVIVTEDDNDNGWDLSTHPAAGMMATDACFLLKN